MKVWPLLPTLVALSSCVTLTDVHEHPHRKHHKHHKHHHPATASSQDLSKTLPGIWTFPQVDPEVSPVVVHFNADATYAMETEAAIFEKGRWSLQGNRLLLVPSKGKSSGATLQSKSPNELIWKTDGKSPLRLTRL